MIDASMITLLLLMAILSVATIIIYWKFPTKELEDRVNSWWYILAFFSVGIIINTTLAMFFFGFLSFWHSKNILPLFLLA